MHSSIINQGFHEKGTNMNTHRKVAIIVGVLFIIATAVSILGQIMLPPIINAPEYLRIISENENKVITGVLLYFINSAAVVAISVMLFPIFRKQNETLALGYVASRIIESILVIACSVIILSLLTLSRQYGGAASQEDYAFHALGASMLSISDWAWLVGVEIVFSLTAFILNVLLYQTKLVPRFISVWGLVGAVLMFAEGLLRLFGLGSTSVVSMTFWIPIALNEMVLAVWLIGKGFDSSAIKLLHSIPGR
jgi:hypothetical protein